MCFTDSHTSQSLDGAIMAGLKLSVAATSGQISCVSQGVNVTIVLKFFKVKEILEKVVNNEH